ncbi:hypothetical protein [Janthinobacterium sp.]|uniref:hypothetical protein n=1 Tax=Janthinobacterium sp. TaxID=1871054 RepID=UPI00258CECD3|nr:hypothetical protein [Janthinobacterium sp.]MCX7294572.1 hypothetical protein [Janthinobacterium sp.]
MSLLKTGDGQSSGPTLLGTAGAAAAQADGKRILSQLEHGAAAPAARPALRWRPGRRHWAAGALCLALLITAMLADGPSTVPLPPAPTPFAATAPPALAVPAAPAVLAHAAQAATIVNTAGMPLPAMPAAAASAVAGALASAGSAGAGVPRKAPPPARQAAVRAQESRPAAAPGDSDVALLTAMVAHAHRQDGTAAPMRDVVLRQREGETAELLQRCRQLGLIEGMLCRSRICSGRWDSDPACH